MKNINAKKIVAVMAALSLASMALMAGCAARTMTYTGLQTPGIMTQPVEDTVKLAAEKAAEEKAAKELAAQREAAKKAAEEAKAAADDAALDGGEIVEDENAPEGTVAVKTTDGETRYVPADKAEKSVQSGNTKPKAESNSGSNGGNSNKGSNSGSNSNSGSSSSNGGSSNSGSNSGSSNSGSSNGGGSASKPAPAPEPEPAPAPAPEPDHSGDHVMNEGSTRNGHCFDCGWDGKFTGSYTCPSCGSDNYGDYLA